MTKPSQISDDQILDILGSDSPKPIPVGVPDATVSIAPLETNSAETLYSEQSSEHTVLRNEFRRQKRSVVFVAISVSVLLCLALAGIYVLIVHREVLGDLAVALICGLVCSVVLVLGVIYVMSPIIVVFQLNALIRQTAETNRLLQKSLTHATRNAK